MRAQLTRILASEIFSRSDRLTAFLTFIVEQSLDGRGVELKEHVLAMEVYGKTADFDAGLDPIVRVDARRLRDKLREYYASAPHDTIVISVPKGSYVPVFETNGHVTPAAVDAIRPAPTFESRVWSVRSRWRCSALCIARARDRLAERRRETAVAANSHRDVVSWRGRDAEPLARWQFRGVHLEGRRHDRGCRRVGEGGRWRRARRLTNTPQFHEAMTAWSPDGRQIAYYRVKGVQHAACSWCRRSADLNDGSQITAGLPPGHRIVSRS